MNQLKKFPEAQLKNLIELSKTTNDTFEDKKKVLYGGTNALAETKKFFKKSLKAIQTNFVEKSLKGEIQDEIDQMNCSPFNYQFALKIENNLGAADKNHQLFSKVRPVTLK